MIREIAMAQHVTSMPRLDPNYAFGGQRAFEAISMRKRFILVFTLLLLFLFASFPVFGQRLTPESPSVKEAVIRGVRYLTSPEGRDNRLGAKAAVGLALIKGGESEDHPRVQESVEAIQVHIRNGMVVIETAPVYTAGLATIFLAELDPVRYRKELVALGRFFDQVQKKAGGWGYLSDGLTTDSRDDTMYVDASMTQYGALAAWELHNAGIPVSEDMVNRLGKWLLMAQLENGQYAYLTKLVGGYNGKPSFVSLKLSTTVYGAGCQYICWDLFGWNHREENKPSEQDLPLAFKKVVTQENTQKKISTSLSQNRFKQAMEKSNQYIAANFRVDPIRTEYDHYYLYAVERYYSFRELAEGRTDPSPRWYNICAEHLLETQNEDGSWRSSGGSALDTAFSILFLVRSSRGSIQKVQRLGGGNMRGGRGLPDTTEQVKVEDGKVISLSDLGTAEKLLSKLEDLESASEEDLRALSELSDQEIRDLLSNQAGKLRRLAGDASPEARIAAVKLLGKSGNVKHAPTLIHALSDDDPDVVRTARDALRNISRMPQGMGLDDSFTETQRKEAIDAWKRWARSIDPRSEFR